MGLGKWLVVFGLLANIGGVICVGWVMPKYSVPNVSSGGPATRAIGKGRWAERYGWWLLGLGFLFQLVGTILWT